MAVAAPAVAVLVVAIVAARPRAMPGGFDAEGMSAAGVWLIGVGIFTAPIWLPAVLARRGVLTMPRWLILALFCFVVGGAIFGVGEAEMRSALGFYGMPRWVPPAILAQYEMLILAGEWIALGVPGCLLGGGVREEGEGLTGACTGLACSRRR